MDYFKSKRRKMGLVTLGLGCVLMGFWMRSFSDLDALFQRNETDTHSLISFNGGIIWHRFWPVVATRQPRWLYQHNGKPDFGDPTEGCDYHWKLAGLGFEFSAFSMQKLQTTEFEYWAIPYWSIAIPLTALSAWLLLSKPKPSIEQQANA